MSFLNIAGIAGIGALGTMGASIAQGAAGSSAARRAAQQQALGIQQGIGASEPYYQQALQQISPWQQYGARAMEPYWQSITQDMSPYMTDIDPAMAARQAGISYQSFANPITAQGLGQMAGTTIPEAFGNITPEELARLSGSTLQGAYAPITEADIARYSGGMTPGQAFDPLTLEQIKRDTGQTYRKNTRAFTAADYLAGQDPSYQWQQDQAAKAIQRSAAARGGVLGGGTMTELQKQASAIAAQDYANAFARDMAMKQRNLGVMSADQARLAANQAMAERQLGYGTGLTAQNRALAQAGLGFTQNLLEQNKARGQAGLGFANQLQGQERSWADQLQRQWQEADWRKRANQLGIIGNQQAQLGGLLGQGYGAAVNAANLASERGRGLASMYSGLGSAMGQGSLGAGQAWQGALGGINQGLQSGLSNYTLLSLLRNRGYGF